MNIIQTKIHIIGSSSDLHKIKVTNSLDVEEGIPSFVTAENVMVAETYNKVIGFLYWERWFLDKNHWFLSQVTVDKKYRRNGIGEKLWRYFLDYAKENKIKSVFATIDDSNVASISLAKKLGAVDAGYLDLEEEKRKFYSFDL